jgi:hypothetical protein
MVTLCHSASESKLPLSSLPSLTKAGAEAKRKAKSNVISAASILDQYKVNFKIRSAKDSFHIICRDHLYGVVSVKGDTLIKPQFASIEKFMKKTSLHFIVSKENKFGAVDNKGRMILRIEKSNAKQVKRELIKREIEHFDLKKAAQETRYYSK